MEKKFISVIICCFIICTSLVLFSYFENQKEIEFSKAGLQQCIEKDTIATIKIWRKTCE